MEQLSTRSKLLLGGAAIAALALVFVLQSSNAPPAVTGEGIAGGAPAPIDLPPVSLAQGDLQRLSLSDWTLPELWQAPALELPEMYRPAQDCGCGDQLQAIGIGFIDLGDYLRGVG